MGFGGDAGIAAGRDGTPQRKPMKRYLVNKPVAAPVPITGRKEVHGNSDPEQPGKALDFGKQWGNEVPVCMSPPWILF